MKILFKNNLGIDKKTYEELKKTLDKKEFENFINSYNFLNKVKKSFIEKISYKDNCQTDYIIQDGKIFQRKIYNYDDPECRDIHYVDCTPPNYKEKYDYCNSILENNLKKRNQGRER